MAKQHTVIVLRVNIADITPPVWRRIVVDSDISLRSLHHIIQAAFGWDSAHLHDYRIEGKDYCMLDNKHIAEGNLDREEEALDDRKGKLNRLLYTGQRFIYQYDFGDSWEHEVEVEKIEFVPEPMGAACIIDGARACPPENVGGALGYSDILKALKSKPRNEQAKDFLEWIGGSFDPEMFDRRAANASLSRLASNGWGQK